MPSPTPAPRTVTVRAAGRGAGTGAPRPRAGGAVAVTAAAALACACGPAVAPRPRAPAPASAPADGMGIPSTGTERGQRDAVGFASTAAQMAEVWRLAGEGPPPTRLDGPPPAGTRVAGILAPHDDYRYAGRVYRAVVPLIRARRVLLLGVFHGWRRFGARDVLVFDAFRTWRTPDGPVPVSPLRDDLRGRLPAGTSVVSNPMHESEHSVEALVYWLHHQRPDLEIVPVLVATARYARLRELADALGRALRDALAARGWVLGRDLQIVISADAVHYGADFKHTPYGRGGPDAYARAVANDTGLLRRLAGPVTDEVARALLATFTDPDDPARYRLTWCGRFSLPFGMMLLHRLAGPAGVRLRPVAYATSRSAPPLATTLPGLGVTAPATPFHFVGYPAAAFVLPPARGDRGRP